MSGAIRKHLRDFLAIVFLVITAAGVGGYILSNQRFHLPGWLPLAGTDFYELDAEFQTAQAVVPGQGQTVTIAGVKIGDIGSVRLDDGVAVVEMKLEERYRGRIFADASILLRPKTGLKDMYLQLDPGSRQAGPMPEGERVPVSRTLPDVNTDEVLSALDQDTRALLSVLLSAGGKALADDGDAAALRATLRRFEPTSRELRRVTGELSKRRRNIARVVHNYRLLAEELARSDEQLARLVSSSNANFGALARRDDALRSALGELPATLGTARSALVGLDDLSTELGPAAGELEPVARSLAPALRDARPFLRETEPVIERRLRPFARGAREEARLIRRAAADLAPSTGDLVSATKVVNDLLDTLAFNPEGAEEGFLFWASWANHAGASLFATQDAHGPVRRGVVLASCTSLGVLEEIGETQPNLKLLVELLNAPRQSAVCPEPGQGARR